MPEPPYRTLRILLRMFSLLAALAGVLMIFAEKPLISRIFLRLWTTEIRRMYPAYLLWGAICGAVRHCLRPREACWEPAGSFFFQRQGGGVVQPDTVALWPGLRQRKR